MNSSPFEPPQPKAHDNRLNWANLNASAQSIAIANFAKQAHSCILVVTSDIHEANRLNRELRFFLDNDDFPLLTFPDWETLAFDRFSPHEDITSQRLATLHRLPQLKRGIIIAALPTLLQRILPKSYLDAHVFVMQKGDMITLNKLTEKLVHAGYHRVDQVREHGEFAVRGSIWDIFPSGSNCPFRIELFDDEIETIRSFDPDTQLSSELINAIELLPAREYPLTKTGITLFRQNFREFFTGNPRDCPIYEAISNGEPFPGSEYYLPLFYTQLTHFFDYLPQDTCLFMPADVIDKISHYYETINKRYEQLRYDNTHPLCQPKLLYLNQDDFFTRIKPFTQIRVTNQALDDKGATIKFNTQPIHR